MFQCLRLFYMSIGYYLQLLVAAIVVVKSHTKHLWFYHHDNVNEYQWMTATKCKQTKKKSEREKSTCYACCI